MTFATVHDLTALLETNIPVWPTSPPPVFMPVGTVARDGYLIEHVDCLTHTGTHMDAPSHFLEGTMSVDRIAPTSLVGSACVLDLRKELDGTTIPSEALGRHWPNALHPEIVLLETGWSTIRSHRRDYLYDFPGIDPAGARWLADHHLKGVGTDTLSIDPFSNTAFEAHKVLLGREMWILEALDHLDELKEGVEYTLVAAPLKIANGSGAMARVFAIETEGGALP